MTALATAIGLAGGADAALAEAHFTQRVERLLQACCAQGTCNCDPDTALSKAEEATDTPLTLAMCERRTHPSHGGERLHRDLGAGHVAWVGWWSMEGTFTDLHVADCADGQMLTARLAEERMSNRLGFDRRDAARRIFESHASGSPAFFRLDTLAHDLRNVAEDIRIEEMVQDPCACAAAYPDMRGDRAEFGGLE